MYLDITEDQLEQIYEEILTMLGAFSIDVDIEKREVLIILRRAFQEFEKETALWQLRNQFGNVYGLPAGLIMSNQVATFNMNLVQQITDWMASMQRLGGKIPWHKDYITLEPGRQIYNLATESSRPYAPGTRRIHRVLWTANPEMFNTYHFNGRTDNIQGDDLLYSNGWNFSQNGLNYGGNPLAFLGYGFDTVLMLQSMETRNKILFSEFFHNISGDILELLPMPGSKSLSIKPGTRVFYYYWNEQEVVAANKTINDTVNSTATSETSVITGDGLTGLPSSEQILISNPLQMKIDVVPYSMLSNWAHQFIYEITFARCKYIVGSKLRAIKKTFTASEGGFEIEFDYQSLLDESSNEIAAIRQDLKDNLAQLNLAILYTDKSTMIDAAKNANRLQPRLWSLM